MLDKKTIEHDPIGPEEQRKRREAALLAVAVRDGEVFEPIEQKKTTQQQGAIILTPEQIADLTSLD